jgi:hypothetical protein
MFTMMKALLCLILHSFTFKNSVSTFRKGCISEMMDHSEMKNTNGRGLTIECKLEEIVALKTKMVFQRHPKNMNAVHETRPSTTGWKCKVKPNTAFYQ